MLKILKVSGDSMEPTLSNEDVVFIARKKNFYENDIVVVNDKVHGLIIKRLKKIYENEIQLVSDNTKTKSITCERTYNLSDIIGKYFFRISSNNFLCKLFQS
tara:strand:+ start:798 stop:1103 length:306 start_codon:yes stop_codon:yes gene_type:complete